MQGRSGSFAIASSRQQVRIGRLARHPSQYRRALRRKVARLTESFGHPDDRNQAADATRGLIEKITGMSRRADSLRIAQP
jgi:hypothetical protein